MHDVMEIGYRAVQCKPGIAIRCMLILQSPNQLWLTEEYEGGVCGVSSSFARVRLEIRVGKTESAFLIQRRSAF